MDIALENQVGPGVQLCASLDAFFCVEFGLLLTGIRKNT